jgi:hypothetical protein
MHTTGMDKSITPFDSPQQAGCDVRKDTGSNAPVPIASGLLCVIPHFKIVEEICPGCQGSRIRVYRDADGNIVKKICHYRDCKFEL